MDYLEQICRQNIERLREQKLRQEKAKAADERRIQFIKAIAGYSADDFGVRKNRGVVESFNRLTGEILYTYPNCEEFTIQEAWQDIRDEFGGGS